MFLTGAKYSLSNLRKEEAMLSFVNIMTESEESEDDSIDENSDESEHNVNQS